MTVQISLTQGQFATIDEEDAQRVRWFKWSAWRSGERWYASTSIWIDGKKTTMTLHRFILNAPRGVEVLFRDGNPLNCTRANLVPATRAQNNQARRKHDGGTSRFVGVCWHKGTGMWKSQITQDGHTKHLGYFADEVEAARVRDAAARKYYGPLARLNFPEGE